MPLNIKNADTHRLAKELAELTGQSITDAVAQALRDALIKETSRQGHSAQRLTSELDDIALHCASLKVLDGRPADDILGYNDEGIPQ